VRRYIDLSRQQILGLLRGDTPAQKSCAEAIRNGANFRIHRDTVPREGALRIYALRTQIANLDGIPTVGVDEAMKDLAASAYPRLRVGAVSGDYDFVLFLDPDCTDVVAVLGMSSRSAR
jgi:hypothetical protein